MDELIRDYRAFKINKRRMASFFTKETYQSAIEAIDNYVNVIVSIERKVSPHFVFSLDQCTNFNYRILPLKCTLPVLGGNIFCRRGVGNLAFCSTPQ